MKSPINSDTQTEVKPKYLRMKIILTKLIDKKGIVYLKKR